MKIAYVVKSFSLWGGGERILTEKMNYLVKMYDHEVFLITIGQNNKKFNYALCDNIKLIDLNIIYDNVYNYTYPLRLIKKIVYNYKIRYSLKKCFNSVKPDIICCLVDDYVDLLTSIAHSIPIVAESHNLREYTRTPGKDKITIIQKILRNNYFNSIKKIAALVSITEGDAKDWSNLKNAIVIPNIVHLNDSDFSDCKNKRVIWVGRLAYQKGVNYAIEVWKTIHVKYPDWELHLYGEGELYNDVIKQISDPIFNHSIILHNPTHDIFKAYKESSILLCTSRYEAFGLIIPEAMSCGLPCVSFDCPYGPRSIIKNGEDGLLVEMGNCTLLSEALLELIDNEKMRIYMGKNAKKNIQRFTPEIIMNKWNELFENIYSDKNKYNIL